MSFPKVDQMFCWDRLKLFGRMIIDRKGTMGSNPDVLRIAQLRIARYQVWAIPRLAILTFTHSTAYGTYYKLQILNKMFFFDMTKFWKLSQYPAKRKFIRTGFAQFLSPIDFSFLLQFSLTRCNNNHNLGNWQAAMNNWYGCILSKSQKQLNRSKSSSITIAASISTSLQITTISAGRCKNIGILRFLLSLSFL